MLIIKIKLNTLFSFQKTLLNFELWLANYLRNTFISHYINCVKATLKIIINNFNLRYRMFVNQEFIKYVCMCIC